MYCRAQLGELQGQLPRFGALGTEVWAVSSTDTPDRLAAYAKVKALSFPLLSDAALTLTRRYGLLDSRSGTMADPATLVIDRSGTVRFARVDADFTQRPPVEDILNAARDLEK